MNGAARSEIDPALIEEYRRAKYHVADDGLEFVLKVGERSADLERLYRRHGVRSAAYVTAWNPLSKPAARTENEAASRWLIADLEGLGCRCLHGFGAGDDTEWEPEASVLALGIDLERARELGKRYGQNAIVFADADATPALVLLR